MAKKVQTTIKLQLPAGKATPAPPVGTALGPHGLNIMDFCKQFNAKTAKEPDGMIFPVLVTVYTDRTFTFILKTPPASILLLRAAGIVKGSAEPNRNKVGKVTKKQVEEIASPRGRPRIACAPSAPHEHLEPRRQTTHDRWQAREFSVNKQHGKGEGSPIRHDVGRADMGRDYLCKRRRGRLFCLRASQVSGDTNQRETIAQPLGLVDLHLGEMVEARTVNEPRAVVRRSPALKTFADVRTRDAHNKPRWICANASPRVDSDERRQ